METLRFSENLAAPNESTRHRKPLTSSNTNIISDLKLILWELGTHIFQLIGNYIQNFPKNISMKAKRY
jgi:hypothetical protein